MANANVINVTDATFDAEVIKSDKPVLVDFWAPWCGPCVQLGPVIDQIADATVGRAKVTKVNIDDNDSIAADYGIRAIPTMLLFKNGQVAEQLVGMMPKAAIKAKITAHI